MITFANLNPPVQDDFDEDDIRKLKVGRKRLATDWPDVLRKPKAEAQDWALTLPFPNTYRNAFETMCDVPVFPYVAATGRLCLYLKGIAREENPPQEIYEWIDKVGKFVAIKDLLAISFTLDFEREGGNPEKSQTRVALLRAKAKPYGTQSATKTTTKAADELVDRCVDFLKEMSCYESANSVVAAPPSDPNKQYNLPRYLAEKIAAKWERTDLSEHVRTIKARGSIKSTAVANKLDALLGTIEVDADVFHKRNVLLIDDLYQSGITMNYCGLMLLQAGARKIFGLACEKTCRNDDNVGGR
jgi:adenine/guanine phosphoribosyltransferase-like PRPP-binding protein